MFKRLLTVCVLGALLGSWPAAAGADVTLEGGQWTIYDAAGDTLATLSADQNRESALLQAFFMDADTVRMTPIRITVSPGTFELWKDGEIIQKYPTQDEAIQGLKDNQGDSISHPADRVTGLKK